MKDTFSVLCLVVALLAPAQVLASGSGGHGFSFQDQGLFIIDFVVLMGVAFFLLRKKVKAALVARADGIRQSMDDARVTYDAADGGAREKSERLDKLQAEREAMLTRFREEAEAEGAKIVEEAEAKARRLVADARRQADVERRQIQESWRRELIDGAFDQAGAAVAKSLDDAGRRRWTDDAIAGLETADWEVGNA
jgi:F-type H+-transporting ATPase subunit b